jgi:4-amino-4-deoxy-L-arabinose transferase-like glycosyltransferase
MARRWLLWITVAGAALRLAYQWDRALLGDEVGTLLWTRKDLSYLLSHFDMWGSMNYFIALEKAVVAVLGATGFTLSLVPLLAGIATIPLTAAVARRLASAEVALMAAVLVAFNPYLVKFSVTARAYAPLAALSLAAFLALLSWLARPALGRALLLALLVLVMILIHPNGAYSLAFFALVLVGEGLRRRGDPAFARAWWSLAALLAAAGLLLALAYHRIYPDMVRVGELFRERPPTGLGYLPYVFSEYFGGMPWPRFMRIEDRGYGSVLPVAVSAIGVLAGVVAALGSLPRLRPLLAALAIPVAALSLQGMSHYPWAFARFLIAILPLLIILLAAGAAEIGRTTRRPPAGWAFVAVVVLCWLPATVEAFADKLDYRWQRPAAFLNEARRADDLVLAAGWLEWLHLQPYLRESEGCHQEAEALPRREQGGLYVVSAAPSLRSAREVATFGLIRVSYYPEAAGDAALRELRDELARAVAGQPLNLEWAPVYRLLFGLSKRLEAPEDQQRYYELWTAAETAGPFRRFMPPGVRALGDETRRRLRPE